MKLSHITLIALVATTLYANNIPVQRIYQEAQQSYTAGEFHKAYELFETLSSQTPDNAEYNFFLGRCALELRRYDEAVTAFDRVLMLNPSHTRTHLELARLHYERKNYTLAQNELDTVLKDRIPDNIKEVVMAFKAKIAEQTTQHTFNAALVFGGGYDSNANNDIGRKEFIIPAFNVPITGNDKVSDSNIFATAVLNHSYDFGEKGGWSLENSFIAYDKLNSKQHQNDLTLFSATTAPTWQETTYKLNFPISYDRVFMDGKGYMHNLSASIKGSYLLNETSQLSGGYSHKQGWYDTDANQDVTSNIFFASYKKAFGANPIVIALNSTYTLNSEVNQGRTDITNKGISYGIEVSKEFKSGLRTSLGYTASKTDYDDVDVLFGNKRADTRDEYELGLGYMFTKTFFIQSTVSYAKNHSNHDPFNYDKTTALISALWSF